MESWAETSAGIKAQVASVRHWWHTIELPGGVVTPGLLQKVYQDWIVQKLPIRLDSLTVLDVGAWDGYFSFLCESRGAKSVLAIDNLSHDKEEGGSFGVGRKGFDIAKELLGSKVEYRVLDLFDIERISGKFDLVLALGVYYHTKHPLLAFERLYQKTGRVLYVEGHFVAGENKTMRFYGEEGLRGDSGCFWGATIRCLESMLRVVGFRQVEVLGTKGDRVILKAEVKSGELG